MLRYFVLAIVSSFLPVSIATAREPTLTVVWNDHYRKFPESALAMLGEELCRFFAGYGISVRLHVSRTGENLLDIPGPRVNAIVTAADGSRYRLSRDAMAATIGAQGKGRNIFVFFPEVARTLGHDGSELVPRRMTELSRAMARVLAHELVHVLAPEREHTETGLMSEKLERRNLLRNTIELDPPSVRLVKARLREWARSDTSVAGEVGDETRTTAPAPPVPDTTSWIWGSSFG